MRAKKVRSSSDGAIRLSNSISARVGHRRTEYQILTISRYVRFYKYDVLVYTMTSEA